MHVCLPSIGGHRLLVPLGENIGYTLIPTPITFNYYFSIYNMYGILTFVDIALLPPDDNNL